MSEALQVRDSFRFRVALDPEAVWERMLAHPKVRVAQEPAPEPPPPEGAPFLVARQSTHELRLRHWAGPADAASPVVIMQLGPDGHGGTVVRGRFENRNRQRHLVDLPRIRRGGRAWLLAGLGTTLLAIALLTPVLVGAAPNMIVSVLALLIWNAEGRKRFIAPLWELVGELMTPIALPEVTGDRPFRGHALPSARE